MAHTHMQYMYMYMYMPKYKYMYMYKCTCTYLFLTRRRMSVTKSLHSWEISRVASTCGETAKLRHSTSRQSRAR